MERHHVANVALWNGDIHQWAEKIKALPMVTGNFTSCVLSNYSNRSDDVCRNNKLGWAAQSDRKKQLLIGIMPAKEEFFKFYDLKLLEGEFISEKSQQNEVVVDESTCLKIRMETCFRKDFRQ